MSSMDAPEKIHIERNSAQETLVIPLYARAQCARLYPKLYQDPESERALERLDYDFSDRDAEGAAVRFGALECAMRQSDVAFEVREYLREHPRAAVVNLGCGLDPMTRNLDNGACTLYNLDRPDVIETRNLVFPPGPREHNIACDLTDHGWFGRIGADEGAVFFATGVFYYLLASDVQALVRAMNGAFPGGRLIFDTAGKLALRIMVKGVVQGAAGIEGVDAYFHAGRPERDIVPWSNGFAVESRGYMLGYGDLRAAGVSAPFRLLARVCDGPMQMKIVRIDFAR